MVIVVVNQLGSLKPTQTTTRLIEAYLAMGTTVAVTDVFSLGAGGPKDLRAHAVIVDDLGELARPQICRAVNSRKKRQIDVGEHETIILRTSPGRDTHNAWAHRFTLEVCQLARSRGINVVNDPVALQKASSKLYSACLPEELRPRTLVTHSYSETRAFLEALEGPAVIKPLLGSLGRDVFFIDGPLQPNLRQICELLGRTDYFLVQQFLPDAANGDYRVLVLDGAVLSVAGKECVIHRVPRPREFRANVSLGARATATELTDAQRKNAIKTAKIVARDGIRFAGLDLVGDRVIEVNVYSTGGIVDGEEFYEVDFGTEVARALASPSKPASDKSRASS